jgi:hypothetical protein
MTFERCEPTNSTPVNGRSSSFGMLSDTFNNVVKSIRDALKTAARAG